jgi:hypothetical protein
MYLQFIGSQVFSLQVKLTNISYFSYIGFQFIQVLLQLNFENYPQFNKLIWYSQTCFSDKGKERVETYMITQIYCYLNEKDLYSQTCLDLPREQ